MSAQDAERKSAECEKELSNLQEEAPFLRTERVRDMIDMEREKDDKIHEKALITMLRKENDRKQNR